MAVILTELSPLIIIPLFQLGSAPSGAWLQDSRHIGLKLISSSQLI